MSVNDDLRSVWATETHERSQPRQEERDYLGDSASEHPCEEGAEQNETRKGRCWIEDSKGVSGYS